MAERHRSKDGTRETEKYTDQTEAASQQGRAGGSLERDVGTQDEETRAVDDPSAKTRVRGKDKRNHGDDA